MMTDERRDVVQPFDRSDDVRPDLWMPPHPGHLVFRQRHRLPEDAIGDSDLSHVVQDCAQPNGGGLIPGKAHPLRAGARQLGQPLRVPASVAVLRLDGIRERHVDLGHELRFNVAPRD